MVSCPEEEVGERKNASGREWSKWVWCEASTVCLEFYDFPDREDKICVSNAFTFYIYL